MATAGHVLDVENFRQRPLRQRVMERIALGLMRLALAVQGKSY